MGDFILIFIIVFGFYLVLEKIDEVRKALKEIKEGQEKPETDRRIAIRNQIGNASETELADYLVNKFNLAKDDPWIRELIKRKNTIGTESAITEIMKKEKGV